MEADAVRPYVAFEKTPGPEADDDDAFLEYARRYGASNWHPAGTCKMGIDPLAVLARCAGEAESLLELGAVGRPPREVNAELVDADLQKFDQALALGLWNLKSTVPFLLARQVLSRVDQLSPGEFAYGCGSRLDPNPLFSRHFSELQTCQMDALSGCPLTKD